ncbi:hypothetical protein KAU45_00595 [bacterium]|nr:hypothetical protein [bacterium]
MVHKHPISNSLVILLILLCSCGEEVSEIESAPEESVDVENELGTETLGALSLTPPSDLWHRADELSTMITLKRGEAAPSAMARFYFNGRDSYDEQRLRRRPSELEEFLERLARGLRDQIELTAGADSEFIAGPDYSTDPYLTAGYAYYSELGRDRYYNTDTAFYVGGRYVFLDISCYADEEEELAGELAALLDSARIELDEPSVIELKPGQELVFGNLVLRVPGGGWSAEEIFSEMLLIKDDRPLVNLYVRRPTAGGAESTDLSAGLKSEIEALYGEVEYLGPVEIRRQPAPYAAVSYRGKISGRPVWRRDAVLAVEEDYYFIDAGCALNSPDSLIQELTGIVDSVGPREEE